MRFYYNELNHIILPYFKQTPFNNSSICLEVSEYRIWYYHHITMAFH